jgi:hypothetical protein
LKLAVQIEEQEFTILAPASQTVKWLALASCQRYMGSALPRGSKGRRTRKKILGGFVLPARVLHPNPKRDVHLEPSVILGDVFQKEDRVVVKLNGTINEWKPQLRCKSRGMPMLTLWSERAFRNGANAQQCSSEEFTELSLADRVHRYQQKARSVSILASSLGTYFESQQSQHKADIVDDFSQMKLDFMRPTGAKARVATNECKNIIGDHFASLQSSYNAYAASTPGSGTGSGSSATPSRSTSQNNAQDESAQALLAFEGLNKLFAEAKLFSSRAQQRAVMLKLRVALILAHHVEGTGQEAAAEARKLAHNRKHQLSLTRPLFLEALMRVATWENHNTDTDLGLKALLETMKPVFSGVGRQQNNPVRVQLKRPENERVMTTFEDQLKDILR